MRNTLENPVEVAHLSLEDGLARLMEIRQEIYAMGANDSKFFLIGEIVEKLQKGKMKPEDAVEEAEAILNGKQDYH